MDLIDRNAVLKLPRNVTKNLSGEVIEETIDVDRIKNLQPFECTVDRWCTDCGEYDAKNHRCPRFNRVIRETVEEMQSEIVHCKDCIHRWHSGGRSVAGKWIRIYRCKRHGIEINLNDFCSFADRRICYTKNSVERES